MTTAKYAHKYINLTRNAILRGYNSYYPITTIKTFNTSVWGGELTRTVPLVWITNTISFSTQLTIIPTVGGWAWISARLLKQFAKQYHIHELPIQTITADEQHNNKTIVEVTTTIYLREQVAKNPKFSFVYEKLVDFQVRSLNFFYKNIEHGERELDSLIKRDPNKYADILFSRWQTLKYDQIITSVN